VHLKVILETGELGSYDNVRRASDLALEAGADVIKTSTGKVGTNATFPVAVTMCEAIRDYARRTGRRAGLKVAGGVRTTKQALTYLVIVKETLGESWLRPGLFRIGASSLLDDLLMQYEKELTGHYAGPDYFPKD
jgi:deoxyribose-phosphate aldolase